MANSRIRLAEARTRYIDRIVAQGLAPTTIRVKNGTLSRLIRDLGDMQMVNISSSHVEEWLYARRGEHRTDQHGRITNPGISAATFNQTLYDLRAFFRWCQGSGFMRHDPTVNIKAIKVQQQPRQQPSPQKLMAIMEAAKYPRDRAYIALAINTGLRQNEIKRLRVKDVDLDSQEISVVITKTREHDRQPISLDLDQELRKWLTIYQAEIGRPFEDDDYLIPATTSPLIEKRVNGRFVHGPRLLRPKDQAGRLEYYVQQAMKACGLPTHYEGTHTIRRAVARAYFDSVSAQQGDVAALRETAALLHHSDMHTTQRYLGMTPEKSRRDKRIKGQAFLSALVEADNVVPLRVVDNTRG